MPKPRSRRTKTTGPRCRSAVTGRFVSAGYAKRHPHKTVREKR